MAGILLQELFGQLGQDMDAEAEHVARVLLKKAGEVSVAGRDTFLAAEADKTLAAMVEGVSEGRAAAALLACAGHKSGHVRAKMVTHLHACTQGTHGPWLAGGAAQPGTSVYCAISEGPEEPKYGTTWCMMHITGLQCNDSWSLRHQEGFAARTACAAVSVSSTPFPSQSQLPVFVGAGSGAVLEGC